MKRKKGYKRRSYRRNRAHIIRSLKRYSRKTRRNTGGIRRPRREEIEKITFEFYKLKKHYPSFGRKALAEEIAAKFHYSIPMTKSVIASIP